LAFIGHYIVVFSEEVVGGAEADVRNLGLARSWIELEEIILHEFVDLHNCGLITTSVAVIGS